MKPIIIDVREEAEYAQGHVSGALHIPLSELMVDSSLLEDIPKESEIIVYCRTGNRSGLAVKILQNKGFKNTKNGINQQHIESGL